MDQFVVLYSTTPRNLKIKIFKAKAIYFLPFTYEHLLPDQEQREDLVVNVIGKGIS